MVCFVILGWRGGASDFFMGTCVTAIISSLSFIVSRSRWLSDSFEEDLCSKRIYVRRGFGFLVLPCIGRGDDAAVGDADCCVDHVGGGGVHEGIGVPGLWRMLVGDDMVINSFV